MLRFKLDSGEFFLVVVVVGSVGVCLFVFVPFGDRILCSPGWPQIHYVTKDNLELLLTASRNTGIKAHHPHTVYVVLGVESQSTKAPNQLSYIPGPTEFLF